MYSGICKIMTTFAKRFFKMANLNSFQLELRSNGKNKRQSSGYL